MSLSQNTEKRRTKFESESSKKEWRKSDQILANEVHVLIHQDDKEVQLLRNRNWSKCKALRSQPIQLYDPHRYSN